MTHAITIAPSKMPSLPASTGADIECRLAPGSSDRNIAYNISPDASAHTRLNGPFRLGPHVFAA